MDRMKKTVVVLCLLPFTTAPMFRGAAPAQTALSTNGCAISAPRTSAIGFPEVKGINRHGMLWALLFYTPPAKVTVTEKIVLRQTGRGALKIVGIGPDHQVIHPSWGPEYHSGSNWNRPGSEWGTGWIFPTSGCWHLHGQRRHASGNVWLEVAPPSTH